MDRPITDKQMFFLISKGYARDDVAKLTLAEASKMIKPYYHRDIINYEYDDDDDCGGDGGFGYGGCFGLGD